jgi:16S rRNA (uracil1498-N3)-methyltransferase
MSRRAFVDDDRLDGVIAGDIVTLPGDVAHRFFRVLRLSDGAAIELFDESGRVVQGTARDPHGMLVSAVDVIDEVLPPLVVLQAVTKTDKLELVVQKATELGASRVVLFQARRSQVRLGGKAGDDDRADKKLARLERIAADAARQCGRARPPTLAGPLDLKAALAEAKGMAQAGVAVAGVVDADTTLSQHLATEARRLKAGGLVLVVGPEGGLDADEVQAFADAGVVGVRWSRFVLRTETAALSALAIAQAALGEA